MLFVSRQNFKHSDDAVVVLMERGGEFERTDAELGEPCLFVPRPSRFHTFRANMMVPA